MVIVWLYENIYGEEGEAAGANANGNRVADREAGCGMRNVRA